MPEGVLGVLKTCYGTLAERFRLGEGRAGEGFTPGSGICQGCPLSVLLVDVLFAVLVERTRTSAATRSGVVANYADDCTFWVQGDASIAGRNGIATALRAFAGHADTFTALTRQEINVRKSWVLETGGALDGQPPLQLAGNVVPVVEAERVLGANVSVGVGPGAVLQRRVGTANERDVPPPQSRDGGRQPVDGGGDGVGAKGGCEGQDRQIHIHSVPSLTRSTLSVRRGI